MGEFLWSCESVKCVGGLRFLKVVWYRDAGLCVSAASRECHHGAMANFRIIGRVELFFSETSSGVKCM